MKRRNTLDQGSTLVEVIIAALILSLVAFSFVNAAASSKKVEKIDTTKISQAVALNSAAQLLNGVPYELCNSNNPQPYSSYESQFPENVRIISRQVSDGANGWTECKDWIWNPGSGINGSGMLIDPNGPAPLAQLITLAYCEATATSSRSAAATCPKKSVTDAQTYALTRTAISKTFAGTDSSTFTVGIASYKYQYASSTQSDVCGLWWGGSLDINLSTTGGTASQFFVMPPGAPSGYTTSISGSTLTITAPSTPTDLTRLVIDVGAFNEPSTALAKPVSISLQMSGKPTFEDLPNAEFAATGYAWPGQSLAKPLNVVPEIPLNLPLKGKGGGEAGTYTFRAGTSGYSFTPTTLSSMGESGTPLSWSSPPGTLALGASEANRNVPVPIEVKWNCWPPFSAGNYNFNFRPQLTVGIQQAAGTIVNAGTCAGLSAGLCSFTITRKKTFGATTQTTGSGQGWKYVGLAITKDGASVASSNFIVTPSTATNYDAAIDTVTFSIDKKPSTTKVTYPCKTSGDTGTWLFDYTFQDVYYGKNVESPNKLRVTVTC